MARSKILLWAYGMGPKSFRGFRETGPRSLSLAVELKAGVNIKAVFWLCITFLTQISRSRFKQSRISLLIRHIYVLGRFVNFLVIF